MASIFFIVRLLSGPPELSCCSRRAWRGNFGVVNILLIRRNPWRQNGRLQNGRLSKTADLPFAASSHTLTGTSDSHPEVSMSKIDFSEILAKIPYGVSVVTMGRGGAKVENGLTISWMSQVSFNPPMLMVAVDKLHYSLDLLRSTKNFCVNLLGEDQQALAARFARHATTGEDKLGDVAQRPADSGAAILTDAVAYFDCEVSSMMETGDHMLVIGRVEDAAVLGERPLLTSASGLRYRK
jgi:flavin reductase (DIM6/NTAB) family NADH-FMN oxidoreductase RutF